MTQWLSRIPMGWKFILALALPLLATVWFAGSGIVERQRLASNMAQLETLTGISITMGELVHHLQRERGMSAGYIGSNGQSFNNRMTGQYPQTDAQITEYQTAISVIEAGNNQALARSLTIIDNGLADLPRIRGEVGNLSIRNNQMVEAYSEIVTELISMIERMSHLSADPVITRNLAAYGALLGAKNLVGIERATLTNAFSANTMLRSNYETLLALIGRQEAYLDVFHNLANAQRSQHLNQELSVPEIAQAADMRQIAIDRGVQGMFNVDPVAWFDLQTVKIERIKAVEDELVAGLNTDATSLLSDARQDLAAYLMVAGIAIAASLALALMTVRSLLAPLHRNLKNIQERGGDLTQRLEVPGTDELSRLYTAFNEASDSMEELVGNIQRTSASVELASGEIAQGNQDLAQRTEEQSASLVETATSMEQLTATVRNNAENTRQVESMTNEMAKDAEGANDIASRATEAMALIHEANEEVTTIVEAIDSIAFQTNLLALNASVEAARAGEHGRGFAVVAQEVRILAGRSSDEAEQIKELISNNVARINQGASLVAQTTDTLKAIGQKVTNIASLVRDIAAATNEQSAGIEQINQAVAQLDEVTQQNAALVEQVAAASRSLDDQSHDMAKQVGQFTVSDTKLSTWKPQALEHSTQFA